MSENVDYFNMTSKKVVESVVILNIIDIIIILKGRALVAWPYHKENTEQHTPIISHGGLSYFRMPTQNMHSQEKDVCCKFR